MQKIIKNGDIAECNLIIIHDVETFTQENKSTALVPLSLWLDDNIDTKNVAGIWLDSEDNTASLSDRDISSLSIIGIHFPVFVDGRGFSHARLLRERLDFQGEIRALGNFIPDQLGYLLRVGFTSFQFLEEVNLENALKICEPFSIKYQGDIADPRPIFLRR